MFDDLIPSAPKPQGGGLFDDLIQQQLDAQPNRAPMRITVNPIDDRFVTPEPLPDGARVRDALHQRGLDITRGEEVPPSAQMLGEHGNLLSAASQGTTPHISSYGGRLLSTEAFEDDGGNILFRNPETGQIVPTNKSLHVALRDPIDNTVKVFERSAATNESPAVGVSRVLSPGLMAGAPTARAMIPAAPSAVPAASDIFSTAKPFYKAFTAEAGKIEIPEETARGMAEQLRRSLTKANLIPELAQPVYAAVSLLEKGRAVSLDDLQNIKRVAGRGFNSPDKNIRDAAAAVSSEIGKIISQISEGAGQNLKTADAIHATAKTLQDLQRRGAVSNLRKGRAGYGGNEVNNMRQMLSPIVEAAEKGRVTGYKPNEIEAIRKIVHGGWKTNTLRLFGQASPFKGIIGTSASGLAAYQMGPEVGVAISGLGMASNKLATVLTGKEIEKLKELVAKRSPAYAAAVKKSVERFEKAQMEFINEPTPNKLAAYVSAARALSSGLARDGISVTSGQLLRSIEAPMKGAADEEEPAVPRSPGEKPDKK
jgi:hypothetical protein